MTTTSRAQFEIMLPWPDRVLHPNARPHWSVKAKQAKAHRLLACTQAKAANLGTFPDGPIHVWIDGYPKDRRRRDADGLLSSCKAYLDGIADALGVDDRRFVPHPCVRDELHKPDGQVRIRLTGVPEDGR